MRSSVRGVLGLSIAGIGGVHRGTKPMFDDIELSGRWYGVC
jgi:hypothetical protein